MRVEDKRAKFDALTRSEQQKYNQWSMDVPRVGFHTANMNLGDANPERIGSTWRMRLSGKNRICCSIDGDLCKVLVVGNPRGH
ncbi:MAG TPA: hypothetical protein VNT79_00935 [Phycisphaerae bacterium]|nr:hypothetical protein [Phycisphaerae bacterium]